jgi:clathrin heavy chain
LQQVQQLNLPNLNGALNDLYIEEGNFERLRQSVDMYANFDLISLARRLEAHECLDFCRVATHLFRKAQQ